MTTAERDRYPLARVVERCDFWRRSPATVGGRGGHKEWTYFCILTDEVDLIVNLSIMDYPAFPGSAPGRAEQARIALLARTPDGRWHGDVEMCDSNLVTLHAGRIDSRFGRSTLAFANGGYHLNAQLATRSVGARIALRPIARPAITRSVPLGLHEPMQWLVVPRLEATGEVVIGQVRYPFRSSAAYHDHNWGRFSWGEDFAWEWGVVLAGPTIPWSLVYYRITDRGRQQVISQGVLLWHGDRHCRTFRDRELDVCNSGLLRLGRCLRVPRIMSLAIPGTSADIPRRFEVEARGGDDALDIAVVLENGAQIGVPNDTDDGLTLISECRGQAHVSGRIRGDAVQFEGPSVVEFNRAA
jgi:hypothetical protein